MEQDDYIFVNIRLPRETRNIFNSEASLLGKGQGEFLKFLLDNYRNGKTQQRSKTNIFRS